MSTESRAERTRRKTLEGRLASPTKYVAPTVGIGNGQPCDGCGDPIIRAEPFYSVLLRSVRYLRFHQECYAAWEQIQD